MLTLSLNLLKLLARGSSIVTLFFSFFLFISFAKGRLNVTQLLQKCMITVGLLVRAEKFYRRV